MLMYVRPNLAISLFFAKNVKDFSTVLVDPIWH
jgi:hypothetical protein